MKQFVLMGALMLGACSTMPLDAPASVGEQNAGYSYIPLDPLPVRIANQKECPKTISNSKDLLDALPDNAVRVSMREISGKSTFGFGPASLGTEGNQYEIILDYISADTANIPFRIDAIKRKIDGSTEPLVQIPKKIDDTVEILVRRIPDTERNDLGFGSVIIPVYVGVGLRLTASVKVIKGSVNLSSLGAIAASVEGGRASGSLVVQTLGINGKQVAASLPLPSELNATTVQNAIQSLGSIKAVMYDAENTRLAPRVTGIYNPLASNDQRLINAIVSELAKDHIKWSPPCYGFGSASSR